MLSPSYRKLYTDFFKAPDGYTFQEAIATTFSLSLDVVLELPAYISLQSESLRADPIGLLEAMHQQAGSIDIYYQKGRITSPKINTDLLSFAEEMTIPVAAPRGGVFHPKIWVIVFENNKKQTKRCRLVILSRNLTHSDDWDISMQVEGNILEESNHNTEALAVLIKKLPSMTVNGISKTQLARSRRLSRIVQKVYWELPKGFRSMQVFVHGINQPRWNPPSSIDTLIISPFCSDSALAWLTAKSIGRKTLISNVMALSKLGADSVNQFEMVSTLAHYFETGDSDESRTNIQQTSGSLHSKIFVYDRTQRHSHVILGSANATHNALGAKNEANRPYVKHENVEIIIELEGLRSQVGSVNDILESKEMQSYLSPFEWEDRGEIDQERLKAEKFLEGIRDEFLAAELSIKCTSTNDPENFALELLGVFPDISELKRCSLRLVSQKYDSRIEMDDSDGRNSLPLGTYFLTEITQYLAIHLEHIASDVQLNFVIQCEIDGLPKNRTQAIIARIIKDENAFFAYLKWFLASIGEEPDTISQSGQGEKGNSGHWLQSDTPLLETLIRTGAHHPERLQDLEKFISDLAKAEKNRQKTIIPAEFRALWDVVEKAIKV
jgi:HKD family nuclease